VQCSNIATPAQVWACRVGPTADEDAWVQLADAATLRAPPAAALAPARAQVAAALAGTRIVTLTLPASAGGASGILAIPPQVRVPGSTLTLTLTLTLSLTLSSARAS